MTRKDYVLIAAVLNGLFTEYPRSFGDIAKPALVNRLATALEADNPNFDRDKFVAACMKGVSQ